MKHLKSSSSDLHRLFERAITVREIAEPLASFDIDRDAKAIAEFMDGRNFDVVGLREEGKMIGYVRRQHLANKPTRNCLVPFVEGDAVLEGEPLLSAVRALRKGNEVFVSVLGQVGGIVTKGDLQKSPVRLWLFGLVSLIEMHMLRVIRERHPDGGWISLLSDGRIDTAKKIFAERKKRNEEASSCDFSDCLQFCDKADILLANDQTVSFLGFSKRACARQFFSDVESLRNALAHSNDIVTGRWPALADLAEGAQAVLLKLETDFPENSRAEVS